MPYPSTALLSIEAFQQRNPTRNGTRSTFTADHWARDIAAKPVGERIAKSSDLKVIHVAAIPGNRHRQKTDKGPNDALMRTSCSLGNHSIKHCHFSADQASPIIRSNHLRPCE